MMIVVITSSAEWERAKTVGYYASPSLETEGFIHCSTPSQVTGVANKHFKGRTDLVLLVVDPEKVTAKVKCENLKGGAELFPHIYGRLNVSAVMSVHAFKPDVNGLFSLPGFLETPCREKDRKFKC